MTSDPTGERPAAARQGLQQLVGLERRAGIHARLNRAALTDDGLDALADAMHEITDHPVVIEDRHGNVEAWAGSPPNGPFPRTPAALRESMPEPGEVQPRAFREGDRLVAVAGTERDVLGVVSLVASDTQTTDLDREVLEHGACLLAIQLRQLDRIARAESDASGRLAERLLAGDEPGARVRARALGYDLQRPHRVVLVRPRAPQALDGVVVAGVRRVARDTGVGSLIVTLDDTVVLVAHQEQAWPDLRAAICAELGDISCVLGVGGVCDDPSDLPRSHHEALLALKLHDATGGRTVVAYDDLGIYRILAEVADVTGIERFVREWLGGLIDYDRHNHSQLVATLSQYFESGRSYDTAARELSVHRNTLKYRLRRIREISGLDLANADSCFNLQLATRAWHTLAALRA